MGARLTKPNFRRVVEMKILIIMVMSIGYILGRINEIQEIPTWVNSTILGLIAFISRCIVDFCW